MTKPYISFEEFKEKFPIQNHSSRVIPAIVKDHLLFDVEVSEYSVDFGSVQINTGSVRHTVIITNKGLSVIPLQSITAESPFSTSLDGPFLLWPNEQIELTNNPSPTTKINTHNYMNNREQNHNEHSK